MSVELLVRVVGAILSGLLFGLLGLTLSRFAGWSATPLALSVVGLVGAVVGFVLTPYVTTRPVRNLRDKLVAMPTERLAAFLVGLFLGLLASALLAVPLSHLPAPLGAILPILAALGVCYLTVSVLMLRQDDLGSFVGTMRKSTAVQESAVEAPEQEEVRSILLDTSVIIDGRITDISTTGFIRSTLLVPGFILSELQHIADSADSLRRNRGRRGLEVLGILQNETAIPLEFTDLDVSDVRDADSKLVALARHLRCPIMTNDYNLNRVADLQGITVLNINDLANAVKALYLPGEELDVRIIQEGKEYGQGVGYLEDGTMVVIEDGRDHIDETHTVTVTKVLQTTAGRMIFARR